MTDLITFACIGLGAVGTWLGCLVLIRLLTFKGVLDVPVTRSSHTTPTPRGGGIAVVFMIVFLGVVLGHMPIEILALFVTLALVGWADDVYSIAPLPRFGAQLIAVISALYLHPSLVGVPGLDVPAYVSAVLVVLGWLWFINLYNFMDGIDGITGVETLSISIGIIAVAATSGLADDMIMPAALIGLATLGFLVVNWHPAKIFLGDVGSIPLGFILAWMLLELAHSGDLASAIILPMYYIADATITLFLRLLRKEKVWQAHKQHFYQRAHQTGLGHDAISIRILGVNIGLIVLAVIAAGGYPFPALVAAMILTAALLVHLGTQERRAP